MKVFVTRKIPTIAIEKLEAAGHTVDVWPERLPPDYDTLRQRVADCDGLLSMLSDRIDAALMDAAPRLTVIAQFAVGFNNIDVAAATERGIRVGNTPGVLTDATADTAAALLLAAARLIVPGHLDAISGQWLTWEPVGYLGQDLKGKTLGIVGMGRIGQAFAERMHGGWGMEILYYSRSPKPEAEKKLGAKSVDFDTLLAESDYISVHANLDDSTRYLFNAAAFKRMKPSTVFINTARGQHVVQSDLVEALRNGTIFAAGLDVTDPEPPSPDDPLLSLPNVVVAPHVGSATFSTRDAMARIAAQNLLAGLNNERLPWGVNAEASGRAKPS